MRASIAGMTPRLLLASLQSADVVLLEARLPREFFGPPPARIVARGEFVEQSWPEAPRDSDLTSTRT
ncbi:MAG: hypothetical protein ACREQV_25690 [Candidatus Binatia bacterium]